MSVLQNGQNVSVVLFRDVFAHEHASMLLKYLIKLTFHEAQLAAFS